MSSFQTEEFGPTYEIVGDADIALEVMRGGGVLYYFTFGAVGATHLLVWSAYNEGLEGALEEAAEWLAEEAPGHITSDEEIRELIEEAEAEGLDEEAAYEQATADLTYTESGYLTSYEWSVTEFQIQRGGKGADPLVWAAFEAALEDGELDEDEWEEAETLLEGGA